MYKALFAPARCLSCRVPRARRVRGVRCGARAPRGTAVRPLRATDAARHRHVPGVRGSPPRVRLRPRRRDAGGPGPRARPGLEGPWDAQRRRGRDGTGGGRRRGAAGDRGAGARAGAAGSRRLARRRWRGVAGRSARRRLATRAGRPIAPRRHRPQRGLDRDERRRNARAQFRAVRRVRATSCWWTTSTRRARPPTCARGCCAAPARRASTWSRSHGWSGGDAAERPQGGDRVAGHAGRLADAAREQVDARRLLRRERGGQRADDVGPDGEQAVVADHDRRAPGRAAPPPATAPSPPSPGSRTAPRARRHRLARPARPAPAAPRPAPGRGRWRGARACG